MAGRSGEANESAGQLELAAEVIQDSDRHLGVVCEKPPVLAKHAKLNGETTTVVVPPASQHFGAVRFGKSPVSCQLFLTRISGQRRRRAARAEYRDSGDLRRFLWDFTYLCWAKPRFETGVG